METRSKAWEGSTRAADSHDQAATDDPLRVQDVLEDLPLAGAARVNVLLMGQARRVRPVLETLVGRLREPVVSWFPGQPLPLPQAETAGTMVLHDIGALRIDDQIQLLEWLGQTMGRTQVVSTASTPLLPRVRAGAFIDTLYYRLNMVYVEMTD